MTTFEPRVIGRNQQAIDDKIEIFQYAIKMLNKLASEFSNLVTATNNKWDSDIKTEFDLNLLRQLLQKKNTMLLLKELFVDADEFSVKLAKRQGREKTIHDAKLPEIEFEQMETTLQQIKDLVIKKLSFTELDRVLHLIWIDREFVLPDSLKKLVENEFTYKTKNERENIALELFQKWAKLLSVANQLGADIYPRDLHPYLRDCLNTKNIKPNYPYLKLTNTGIQDHIREINVSSFFTKNDSNRILAGLQNLKEADLHQIQNEVKNI